jgi:hypothetical protein
MESNHDPVPALLVLRNFGVQGAEAAQRELRPPMVMSSRGKAFLVILHLFKATKLPFFLGLKGS